jgi:hypothetical protein
MPRPRDPSGYPTQYELLVELAIVAQEEIKHVCKTKKEAEALRFSIYDWKKALQRSDVPKWQKLALESAGLMFCIVGNTLVIKRRDLTDTAQQLQATFEQYGGLNRLMGKEPMPIIESEPDISEDSQDDVLKKLGYTGKKKTPKKPDDPEAETVE